jgi:2-hydroxy-3-keto-5-methylthiopentenyl-1-phosphate phosphatase
VVANRLEARPDGWVAAFEPQAVCTVCGEQCKRGAVADLASFAYAGDGVSDRCVALAADRVFARAGLAEWLAAREVVFEPFEDFVDLARRLDGDAAMPTRPG